MRPGKPVTGYSTAQPVLWIGTGVELVDAGTGTAHRVGDQAVLAGQRAGRYVAMCAVVVSAASLTTTAENYCRSCGEGIAR